MRGYLRQAFVNVDLTVNDWWAQSLCHTEYWSHGGSNNGDLGAECLFVSTGNGDVYGSFLTKDLTMVLRNHKTIYIWSGLGNLIPLAGS